MTDALPGKPMPRRRRIIVLIAVGLAAFISGAVLVLRKIERDVYEAYALRRANYMLIDYVCEHQRWPDDWSALIGVAERSNPGSGDSDVAELREVVGINWDLDIAALLRTSEIDDRSHFRTTHLLSGSESQWADPTEEIYFGLLNQCGERLGVKPGRSTGDVRMERISAAEYLASCKRRFGKTNPERMRVAAWEWMVRTGNNPYVARESLGLESNYGPPGHPDWCFDRMGAARVEMPDGRVITIAGEHEDFYDPDFCIYNDVVVQQGDSIEIYGYPRATFPPTDFHTATVVDTTIYVVGSLGYQGERGGSMTPVFRIDTNGYRIERVVTTGESPGWIHKHRAEHLADIGVIEVTSGERVLGHGDSERFRDNFDTYHLNLDDGTWERVTDNRSWRQFSLEYADDDRTIGEFAWYTGEVLRQLGYPCELYDDDADGDEEELRHRSHVVIVDGVRVLCADRYGEIRVTIQGELEQAKVDELLGRLKDLARQTRGVVTKVVEL